mmetsp:Transcript_26914/g.41024  ORF Transcript_26914/g.41024 Transcript_26914/m.41024 type:complete len:109 (+) Transcript_26914:1157-1483(+)
MYVYLIGEQNRELLLVFPNDEREEQYHKGAEVNQTILHDLYDDIKEKPQTIVNIGPFDIHSGFNNSITFAQPIFKDPTTKESILGIIVWEMDFEQTFDVIVIPKSFSN